MSKLISKEHSKKWIQDYERMLKCHYVDISAKQDALRQDPSFENELALREAQERCNRAYNLMHPGYVDHLLAHFTVPYNEPGDSDGRPITEEQGKENGG